MILEVTIGKNLKEIFEEAGTINLMKELEKQRRSKELNCDQLEWN